MSTALVTVNSSFSRSNIARHRHASLTRVEVEKRAGEYGVARYVRGWGQDHVSRPYSNSFGHRQDPPSQYSGVLARFISLMLAGETPTIFGDGPTSRDFTYIDNV